MTGRGGWSTTGSPSSFPSRRGAGPARDAGAGRRGRHPVGSGALRGGQHADHRLRARRPRLDAAGRGRPGGARGHDRRAAADRRVPRGGAGRDRGPDRRQHPGRHEEQRHPRPCRAAAQRPHLLRPHPDRRPRRDPTDRPCRVRRVGLPEGARVRALRPVPAHRQRRGGHRPGRVGVRRLLRGAGRNRSGGSRPARTSATSPRRSASRTPTGSSAASTPAPTRRRGERGGSPRTSPSTTPRRSRRSSNPRWTPAPRRWWSPLWRGWRRDGSTDAQSSSGSGVGGASGDGAFRS